MKSVTRISLPFLLLLISLFALPIATGQSPEKVSTDDTIRLEVDLVVLDALVLQQKTARPVGDLKIGRAHV